MGDSYDDMEGMAEVDHLPEWANVANRALYDDMKSRNEKLAVTGTELVDTKDRITVMEGHLQSVVAEQQHTQALVDAKIKEIETEDHLKQLAERERGRFASE